jgi:hypothetical protein
MSKYTECCCVFCISKPMHTDKNVRISMLSCMLNYSSEVTCMANTKWQLSKFFETFVEGISQYVYVRFWFRKSPVYLLVKYDVCNAALFYFIENLRKETMPFIEYYMANKTIKESYWIVNPTVVED